MYPVTLTHDVNLLRMNVNSFGTNCHAKRGTMEYIFKHIPKAEN